MMTPENSAAPDAISTEGRTLVSSETSVRRQHASDQRAKTPQPEGYDGGRTLYRDPTGDRAVRNVMRGSR